MMALDGFFRGRARALALNWARIRQGGALGQPLRLLLWSSLILPPLLALFLSWANYERTLQAAHSRALHTATVLREHALRVFDAQTTAMSWIDSRLKGKNWDEIANSSEIHGLLSLVQSQQTYMDGIWLVAPDGRTVSSADFFPMPPASARDRDYYRVLREKDVTWLGETFRGKIKGNLKFSVSRRRSSPDGRFDGAIVMTLSLDPFFNFWHETLSSELDTASLVRDTGEILVRFPLPETGVAPKIPPISPFHRRTRDIGTYEFVSVVDGVRRIYAYAKIGEFPVYASIGFAKPQLLAGWWRETGLMAATAVLAMALLGTAARAAIGRDRQLADEIRRRARAEKSLVAKEEHVAAIERAERATRRSEEKFRRLYETLTQGVLIENDEGRITSANASAERILARSAQAIAGRPLEDLHIKLKTDSGEVPLSDSEIYRAAKSGEVMRGLEARLELPSGSRHSLVLDAIPQWRGPEDKVSGLYWLISDVTEERRTQEAQRLLMAEIDHRAKNALAVVQAAIRLTPPDEPARFVAAVEGRISALARAHSLLSASRWEGAGLEQIITEEINAYGCGAVEVRLSGPKLTIAAMAVQPLGMAIHELASNAAKYGALSGPGGRLDISWKVSDGAAIHIYWDETAPTPIRKPQRYSFGSTLIKSSIEDHIQGSIVKHWRRHGLCVEISLPASAVARQQAAPENVTPQPADGGRDLRGRQVLYAEDNAIIGLQVMQDLANEGCTVLGPANTVARIRKLAAENTPDIALLDVDLRGEHVFDAASELRARRIPVVFCTGFGDVGSLDARWEGINVLKKPFTRAELVNALRAALA